MGGPLFPDRKRTDDRPKRRREGTYQYLDRASSKHASRVRSLLESWYHAFPGEGKYEVMRRLQFGGSRGFESAVHELLLCATITTLGCRLGAHPGLKDSSRRPDFSIESPQARTALLEAVVVTNQSDTQLGADERKDNLLDALDSLETEDFFIEVDVVSQSKQTGSGRKLRRFVRDQLQGLSVAEVRRDLEQGKSLPAFLYEDDGWTIKLSAFPKSSSISTNSKTRAIGVEWVRPPQVDPATPLRAALKRKAGHYGKLGEPFIIAVNVLDDSAEEIDCNDALFGTKEIMTVSTAFHSRRCPNSFPKSLGWTLEGRERPRVQAR